MLAVNPDGEAAKVEAVPRADVERWLSVVAGPGRFSWLDGTPAGPSGGGGTLTAVEERSTPFDVPLLVAAVVLAVVEMFLARRFSHASVAGRTPGLSASLPSGGGIVAPARAGEGAA